MATKDQLIAWFANGLAATGEKFEALITSLKGRQSPVSDPTASGTSVTFIANISQDEEGVITATKKNVSFSGYQTVAGMAGYQSGDLQRTGTILAPGTTVVISNTITHNMGHYPTVRLLDSNKYEIRPTEEIPVPFTVQHVNDNSLIIELASALNTIERQFTYVLD